MATGITVPKKLTCYSQSGDSYIQMLKKDEIRSDVVVQQLFLLLNNLLEEEKFNYQPSYESLKVNQILLRTYHVNYNEIQSLLDFCYYFSNRYIRIRTKCVNNP